jgi:hypothetical protein
VTCKVPLLNPSSLFAERKEDEIEELKKVRNKGFSVASKARHVHLQKREEYKKWPILI